MSDKDLSKKSANERLISCPFCGGKAQVSEHVIPVTRFLSFGRRRITSEFKYGITCQECGAMSSQYFETMGEAVNAWNTRVPVPQGMSAVEYFKEKARMKATLLEECKKRVQCREPNCHICQWSYRDRVPDGNFERKNPQQAVAIVEKWAREHPKEGEE